MTARSRSTPPRNGPAREHAHALGHRQAVLEQPVLVGLVVVLGRRCRVVRRAALGGAVDQPPEQRSQVRPLDRLDQRLEVGGHLLVGPRRRLGEVGQLVLVLRRDPHALDRDGGAVALVDRVAAEDAHDRAGRADRGQGLHLVPDHGLHGARGVAELELQEGLAVAPLAPRVGAHDEDLVDLLAVGQVAHEAPRGGERGLLHRDLPR